MASALSLLPIEHVWVPRLDTDDNEMLSQMEEELKAQVQQHSERRHPRPHQHPTPLTDPHRRFPSCSFLKFATSRRRPLSVRRSKAI